ncbi:MAG TPA: hypothetical protein VNO26_05365 [Candidatus Limnocylindria bacterium]|nr:hypothetical protein [Candidatus Limnocylindria bacterium]
MPSFLARRLPRLLAAAALAAALLGPAAARARVTVSLPDDLCADPGAIDIDVPVELANADPPTPVRGIQLKLRDTPDELTFVQGDCAERTAGFACSANEVVADNVIRLLILDLLGGSIAPGTGAVATVRLADPIPACTPGEVIALDIEDLSVADENNQPIEDAIAVSGAFTCGCPTTTTTTSTSTTTTTTIVTTTTASSSSSSTSTTVEPTTTTTTAATSTSSTVSTSTTVSSTTSTSEPGATTSTTVTTSSSSSTTSSSSSSTSSSVTSSTAVTTTSSIASTSSTLVSTTSTLASTTTTTSSSSTTTTSTTVAARLPGGPVSKTASDCYLELLVAGVETGSAMVRDGRKVLCTDGEACDAGPCGDGFCAMRAAACINQTDANLPDCTPPAGGLDRVHVRNAINLQVPTALAAPACSPWVDFSVEARLDKSGKYVAKKSRVVMKGKARAVAGTKPRNDGDTWILQCLPRTTDCSAP